MVHKVELIWGIMRRIIVKMVGPSQTVPIAYKAQVPTDYINLGLTKIYRGTLIHMLMRLTTITKSLALHGRQTTRSLGIG
jgi:hypothetical protein